MGGGSDGFKFSGPGRTALQAYDEQVCEATCDWLKAYGLSVAQDPERRPFMMVAGLFFPHNPWIAPADDYEIYDGRIGIDDLRGIRTKLRTYPAFTGDAICRLPGLDSVRTSCRSHDTRR